MSEQNKINRLFKLAKDQKLLLDNNNINSLINSGELSPGRQSSNFRFNKSGLPKNSMFNLKNVLIMTSAVAAITIAILSILPVGQTDKLVNSETLYYIDGVRAISSIIQEDSAQKQKIKADTIRKTGKKINLKENIRLEPKVQTAIKKSVEVAAVLDLDVKTLKNLGFQEYNKSIQYYNMIAKNIAVYLNIDSTGSEGNVIYLNGADTAKHIYLNLGVPISIQHSDTIKKQPESVPYSIRTPKFALQLALKMTGLNFYPDYITDLTGKSIINVNNVVNDSSVVNLNSESINLSTSRNVETLIPVLINIIYSGNKNNYLAWFNKTDDFIKALPYNIGEDIKLEYAKYINFTYIYQKGISIDKKESEENKYFQSGKLNIPGINELNLYPNPVDEVLNIDFVNESPVNIDMYITDISGKLIQGLNKSFKFNNPGQHSEKIMLGELVPGIYILMLRSSDGSMINKRIVVQ